MAGMLGLKPTSPELVKFLQSISALNNSGRSALQDAASSGEISEVRRLLATGSYVDEVPTEKGGRTALQAAAENGRTEVVRILLDAGASVNEAPAPEDGLTSLQAASGKGNCELVELLINESQC
jgi:ankyrin repeat protein